MNDEHGFHHAFEHDDGKGQEMQSRQGLRQALISPHQPTKTRCPAKTALDHPTAREKHKPSRSAARRYRPTR